MILKEYLIQRNFCYNDDGQYILDTLSPSGFSDEERLVSTYNYLEYFVPTRKICEYQNDLHALLLFSDRFKSAIFYCAPSTEFHHHESTTVYNEETHSKDVYAQYRPDRTQSIRAHFVPIVESPQETADHVFLTASGTAPLSGEDLSTQHSTAFAIPDDDPSLTGTSGEAQEFFTDAPVADIEPYILMSDDILAETIDLDDQSNVEVILAMTVHATVPFAAAVDSACSQHCFKDPEVASSLTTANFNVGSAMASANQRVNFAAHGTVLFKDHRGEYMPWKFSNAVFSQQFSENLLSISQMVKQGWKFEFSLERAGMSLAGRWFPFREVDGLYFIALNIPGTKLDSSAYTIDSQSADFTLHLQVVPPGATDEQACAARVRNSSLLQLWHNRLSHRCYEHIEQIANVFEKPIKIQGAGYPCDSCKLGKSRAKYPTANVESVTAKFVGEKVTSDTVGPIRVVDGRPDLPGHSTESYSKCKKKTKKKYS